MNIFPKLISRNDYIKNTIKRKTSDYINSFSEIEFEINYAMRKINSIIIENGAKIEYVFLGRSSTDLNKINLVKSILNQPIKETINEYNLEDEDSFQKFIEKTLPHSPSDRDYSIITNIELTYPKKDKISEYIENTTKISNKITIDINPLSITDANSFKNILKDFPYLRNRDHIKDIPFNSVEIFNSNNAEINCLLENIKKQTGNPRTYEEFKVELKEFKKSIETSPWF